MEGGTPGDAIEKTELIGGESKGGEDFEVKFFQRLRRDVSDFIVEARTPAEDAPTG